MEAEQCQSVYCKFADDRLGLEVIQIKKKTQSWSVYYEFLKEAYSESIWTKCTNTLCPLMSSEESA